MRKLLLSLFATILALPSFAADAPPNQLTDAEKAAGWQLLFDGQDASKHWRGFKKETLPEQWKVEDGTLVRHGGGDIITRDQFDSFELSIEWKISVHICLQDHNNEVAFRNIKIRPLSN